MTRTSSTAERAVVPPALQGVLDQLDQSLNLRGFQPVEEIVARTRAGANLEVRSTTALESGVAAPAFLYLTVRRTWITGGGEEPTIHLEGLKMGLEMPVPARAGSDETSYTTVGIESDVDIRPGQHAVVGRTGVGVSGGAAILVLSARIIG
jgi:hypothetical protein